MSTRLSRVIRDRALSIRLGIVAGALVLILFALVTLARYQAGSPGKAERASSGSAYGGTPLDGSAAGFRLTDQNGTTVSLSDFRGMVVVLTLLDPDCTDICPLYGYQYRLAYQSLGEDAANVAFLAFNANDEKSSVDDVAAATEKWGVDEIPTWHFLTGSPEALRTVWGTYGVSASGAPKPGKPDEKQHSPAIFIIDQAGQRRWYVSTNFEGAPPASALIVKHVKALLAEGNRG